MSTEQEKATSEGGVKKWILGIASAVTIAAIAGVANGFISPPGIKAWACQSSETLGNNICGENYKHIDVDHAEGFLMHYYSKAGAPGETGGWGMLTKEYQDRLKKTPYIERWSDYSWAEVITDPKKSESQFNVFTLQVRHYSGDENPERPKTGWIQDYRMVVRLESVNGSLFLADERTASSGGKPREVRAVYPTGILPTAHVTYHNALQDERHIALHLDRQEPKNGQLQILCKLDETDPEVIDNVGRTLGQDDVNLWYRTPVGWIPASAMPNAKADEAEDCNYRYAEMPYPPE